MKEKQERQLERFMQGLMRRSPGEKEFHQAVLEVAHSIIPFIHDKPEYHDARILERLTEPDRIITFRVCWEDDRKRVRVNRGYRVQHNNSIGPYKGGLRFTPNLTLSVLKFLAFEQTFKNSLTGLPLGSGKGGSDFNPKGKSDREVMRFCHAFMTELSRHIGPFTDIPAGDIGVGHREISYLFAQYKRIANQFTGVLTGKGLAFGGSLIRTEATGYGTVYFLNNMLKEHQIEISGKTAVVSGSGNVAQHAIEKLMELGVKVVAFSDTRGFIHDPAGIDIEKLTFIKYLKNVKRGSVEEFAKEFKCDFYPEQKPWSIPCDLALPCSTQNELDSLGATSLIENGCIAISEGANMPSTPDAIKLFMTNNVLYGPSKAANAGGVAVSGLEMTQNSMRLSWTREELDDRLQQIMASIHNKCLQYGREEERVNYMKGANIAGFVKVADAMLAYGIL